ncbi:MAG: prepilin-type N-terminal cleavage/methylation domain-containing protein [Oscillospiraceae bacterium]|nr:prepilin-type N-terminal cleavage/methylation domain-containing protein [Oscillospiraceae bacterium]
MKNKIHRLLRQTSGFTLMELLLAVAIIGALAAIAMPALSTQIEGARASVCEMNRSALYTYLSTQKVIARYASLEEAYQDMTAEQKESYGCPSHGTIAVSKNTVTCTKHVPGSDMDAIMETVGSMGPSSNGFDAIRTFYEANGNALPELKKDSTVWNTLFGDRALHQNPSVLYWRPSRMLINGKESYVLFASAVAYVPSQSNNSGINAAWSGFACYYNGVYYVSTKANYKGDMDNASVAGCGDPVETWLQSHYWKKVS